MRVGVIIPDRGDRAQFLSHCKWMIAQQTLPADEIILMDAPAISPACDITWRYRIAYERMSKLKIDVIAFMENDDWYDKEYLSMMVREWGRRGKPEIFGTNYTIYYHLGLRAYFTMHHDTRASAMNTLIRPNLNIAWPVDEEPYTDLHLWKQLKGSTWKPPRHISIGMKHGIGLCGGRSHLDRLDRYLRRGEDDNGFLEKTVDAKSFQFYNSIQHDTPIGKDRAVLHH